MELLLKVFCKQCNSKEDVKLHELDNREVEMKLAFTCLKCDTFQFSTYTPKA